MRLPPEALMVLTGLVNLGAGIAIGAWLQRRHDAGNPVQLPPSSAPLQPPSPTVESGAPSPYAPKPQKPTPMLPAERIVRWVPDKPLPPAVEPKTSAGLPDLEWGKK